MGGQFDDGMHDTWPSREVVSREVKRAQTLEDYILDLRAGGNVGWRLRRIGVDVIRLLLAHLRRTSFRMHER